MNEPITIRTDDYTVTVRGLAFYVYQKAPRMVTETTQRSGVIKTQERPFTEVFKVPSDPDIFHAVYHPQDDRWGCDLDCGAQRYCCTKTTNQLRWGMKRLGLSPAIIKQIFAQIKRNATGAHA